MNVLLQRPLVYTWVEDMVMSDHRPVIAIFSVCQKNVDTEAGIVREQRDTGSLGNG